MNVILLAAGLSTRMGTQKLLLPFRESTVIETVIANLRDAGLSHIYAVFSKEVSEAVTKDYDGLTRAINPAPERGQSSSLAIGLSLLPDGRDFCIMLGDLPTAEPDGIAALIERFRLLPPDKTVLTPAKENGGFGHPMFYRALWKERFKSAHGDVGGRKILFEHEGEILRVPAPDGHFLDIDTPDDYKNVVGDN